MDFFESKLIGDEFENKILSEITIKCGLNGKLNDVVEKFKEFDIILSNDIKIECKHDLQFQTTNNFIIETHCNDNESGILTTKADYWILGNLEYIYIFTTENLKKCIAEKFTDLFAIEEPPKFVFFKNYPVQQSDSKIKRMNFYKIPINVIKEYSTANGRIDEINYNLIFCNKS